MKEGWEAWESDFLEKKWCNEGENASWWSVWIVTMEEERRKKREKQTRKTKQKRWEPKKSPPPLFYHLSCWVNSPQKKKKIYWLQRDKSLEKIFNWKISINKYSRDKSPEQIFNGQISMNKYSRDKSPE